MDWSINVGVGLLAYLFGSIPVAYVVARRLKGIDIRTAGSGNVGAVNTFKSVGPAAGALVLAADALKGVLAAGLPTWLGMDTPAVIAAVIGTLVGHNWSIFLRLDGGKGVATVMGVSFVILPVLTLITVVPTAGVMWITRNPVAGVAFGLVLLNGLTIATSQPADQIVLCLALTVIVVVVHYWRARDYLLSALRDRRWLDVLGGE